MRLRLLAPLGAALMLAGCASGNTVVILPPSDGHGVGGVVMQARGKTVVLDKAYASASPGDVQAGASKAEEVNTAFADVLAARPIPPKTYILKFPTASDELTPESAQEFEKVFPEIARRKAAEIVITGHTDTVGSLKDNDELSLKRAQSVRNLFLTPARQKELPAGISITPAGRGERDAKVPNDTENADERYVEITVQ